LLQPGDAVLIDDPGYFNYHAVLRAHRARALPVPYTESGPDLAAMERLAAAEKPKLYLANPALQNPTGLSLTPGLAHRVLNLAQRFDFRIVEDDVFRDFSADGTACCISGASPRPSRPRCGSASSRAVRRPSGISPI
jgi:DNA-binding transcriptional MocR family regulator